MLKSILRSDLSRRRRMSWVPVPHTLHLPSRPPRARHCSLHHHVCCRHPFEMASASPRLLSSSSHATPAAVGSAAHAAGKCAVPVTWMPNARMPVLPLLTPAGPRRAALLRCVGGGRGSTESIQLASVPQTHSRALTPNPTQPTHSSVATT